MLISLKTLEEDIFTVEIDPSQTVRCFKEKIETVKGNDFPAKNMKLMYAGKFLVDNKRISDYKVEEKKFIIVVVNKPKIPIVNEEAESSADCPIHRNSLTSGQRNGQEENRLGALEQEALVRHIIELGFPRQEVEAALGASYNNPDRAVEYLITGVLPNAPEREYNVSDARRNCDHVAANSSETQDLGPMSQPSSPESATVPNDRIIQLFNEAMDGYPNQTRAAGGIIDPDIGSQSFGEMEATIVSSASSSISNLPPSNTTFPSDRMFETFGNAFNESSAPGFAENLMDRDHEAIERLKQLGFSENKAIEAYFVCERNENAAAEYLFSQNLD